MIDRTERRKDIRRHECDVGARSNDQDVTALSRIEEFTGPSAKVVTSMRSMAMDCVHVFGPTRDVAN
jgi:hypothetical protein